MILFIDAFLTSQPSALILNVALLLQLLPTLADQTFFILKSLTCFKGMLCFGKTLKWWEIAIQEFKKREKGALTEDRG